MLIQRKILQELQIWKDSVARKPLILQGPRQVGKTWMIKQFGQENFDQVAYFNFEKQPELKQFFEVTKDPARIIDNLTFLAGHSIVPGKTLVIFDEIQECNDALNSLKYFCEEMPDLAIVSAGSLLGVALSRGVSFPVGKVDFLDVTPVTFSEFLQGYDPNLFSYLDSIDRIEPIPDIFFNALVEKLKIYFISGGMPEAVATMIETRSPENMQQILQNIIRSYQLDFSKYVDNRNIQKINYIWSSLSSQLARENRKFLYQAVKQGARAREYEDALQWLINAGLVYRVFCSTKPGLPVKSYDDLTAFKIYLFDVGILRRLSYLNPLAVTEGNRLFTEFKGALTENYILQSLVTQFEEIPRYWKSGNLSEVDFLLQHENEIIPVEVKSDENFRSKSLTFYRKQYMPEISVRFSLKNLRNEGGVVNIPLFLADQTRKILSLL
jgi:predicted AAA+ superfamily ATPase